MAARFTSQIVTFAIGSFLMALSPAVQAQPVPTNASPTPSFNQLGFQPPIGSLDLKESNNWIPLESEPGELLAFSVVVNGERARAVIDTGVQTLTLSKAYATARGIKTQFAASTLSVGGASRFYQAEIQSVKFGGVSMGAGSVIVADLSGLASVETRPIDVVLGALTISGLTWEVDFDNRRMRFLSPGSRPLKGQDVRIVADTKRLRPLASIKVGALTLDRILIDTGMTGELLVSEEASARLPAAGIRYTDVASLGIGGTVINKIGTIAEISMDQARFRAVPTEIGQQAEFFKQNDLQGMIGLGLLHRHNFALDITSRRLTLAPRTRTEPVAPKSTVGLQSERLPDRWRISHVMANSPAARSALRKGDEICAVNGTKMANIAASPLKSWSTDRAGTIYRLTLCDGRSVALTAADFY